MSLPAPVAVRLKTSRRDRHVTREVRNLKLSSGVNAGFRAADLELDRPLRLDPDDIQEYGDLIVSDTRTAERIWQGRLETPGRGARPDGEVWNVRAVGGAAHARDRTVPLVYVNRSLEPFYVHSASMKKADLSKRDESTQNGALQVFIPRNTVLSAGDVASWRCEIFSEAGMKLARIRTSTISGVGGSDNQLEIVTRASGTVAKAATSSTSAGSLTALVVTDFTDGDDIFEVRYRRINTGSTVGSDDFWHWFYTVIARAMLKDASGADITTGYTTNTVLTHEIVKDLLGRLLSKFDGANASIDTSSTYTIEQLAYLDGVTAEQVLSDLTMFEPKFFWAAWEDRFGTGKHFFEWKQWPTTVAFDASAADGFDSPASAFELYNAVVVRWRDERGQFRRTRRTQTVADLDAAGLTRETRIDIGDELASLANAQRVGDQFLAEHASAPNAGTLTIRRPLLDQGTGRRLLPHELVRHAPGKLVRVRDVVPSIDALNATDRNGYTVFRIVDAEWDAASNTTTLQLDSRARRLSQMVNRRPVARRR